MGGWKTWVAAIGAILGGLSMVIVGFTADPQDWNKISEGYAMILAGLAIIGIGHKIEKLG